MNLVWKLLRQHVSLPQFVGFFFANLLGMLIVLLGYQFYSDVMPIFTQGDSFMGADYLILSKKISTSSSFMGSDTQFDAHDIENVSAQSFVKKASVFTSTEYKVDARMGINGTQVLSSELFLESVPDGFIDVPLSEWQWNKEENVIPIILPRSYINMYNFGFAQSHSLPKISEGLMGMIDLRICIHGNEHQDEFKGKIIGFSTRLNSILVPQAFMDWSNDHYAPNQKGKPSRLIVEVDNPTDEHIAAFIEDNGLEVEDNKLQTEKTTYFLKVVVMIVMSVGLLISLLSFYILMLSIYLLVQKNSSKLENLLLIGYSTAQVARPYQLLTLTLNVAVLSLVMIAIFVVRAEYMDILQTLYPNIDDGTLLPAVWLGAVLVCIVSIINVTAIRQKVVAVWRKGRVAVFLMLFAVSASVSAQTGNNEKMGDLFATMPDSLMPYLSSNNRLDLIDFANAGMKSEVENLFSGTTKLETLTDNYMKILLNEFTSVEMKLLPTDSILADSTSCVIYCVTTYHTDNSRHSVITKYSSRWNRLSCSLDLARYKNDLVERQPTTTDDEWQVVQSALESSAVIATLSEKDNTLSLSLFFSLYTKDEKTMFKDKVTLKTLKINL